MLEYDVLTIGNHELYAYESAKEIYDNRVRWWVISLVHYRCACRSERSLKEHGRDYDTK